MIRTSILTATIAAIGWLASAAASAASVAASGVGATFPQPVYARWAALYAVETGEGVGYDGTGSGAGITAIEGGGVAFGASDTPLDQDQLSAHGLVQFPTMIGGVVPVVDLPGVGPGDLVLDGPLLADLFIGHIGFWDDPTIAARNPHLPLPHLAVTVVRRSDSSGTTAVFVAYLARAPNRDPNWLGQAPPVLRPIGIAVEGSRGVADAVAATPGAIGYVGFDYAQANRLAYADLVNPAGRVVQPTLASIAAAAAAGDWSHGLTPSLVAQPGGASWPIVTATYALMRRGRLDDAMQVVLRFFAWSQRSGGPAAEDLGFVPLPSAVAEEVSGLWGVMTDTSLHTIVHKSVVIK